MDAATLLIQHHSADVRMELRLNGQILAISHLGPDFLILATPADYPSANAEIAMTIDGHASRWPIHLPHGLSVTLRRTPIARRHFNGSTVG